MSAVVDFCGSKTRLQRDSLGLPGVEGHRGRQGARDGLGGWCEAAAHQAARLNSKNSCSRDTAWSVLLYILTYSSDIQIQVKDRRVVRQKVSEVSL